MRTFALKLLSSFLVIGLISPVPSTFRVGVQASSSSRPFNSEALATRTWPSGRWSIPLFSKSGRASLFRATRPPNEERRNPPPSGIGRRLRRTLFLTSTAMLVLSGGVYGLLRLYQNSFSVEYSLESPAPIMERSAYWQSPSAHPVDVATKSALTEATLDSLIANRQTDRTFWNNLAANMPNDMPVTSIVTTERMKTLFESGQLDNLFNGLRSRPEVLYRFLSDISESETSNFARYFATLKSGTRQQVFQLFYRRLRRDLSVLENASWIKKIVYPKRYNVLTVQAERMERLYATMAQTLNRAHSLKEGVLPDDPVAPLPDLGLTQERSIESVYRVFSETIDSYQKQGFVVTLPYAKDVNISEVVGLIGYYTNENNQNFYLEDNQAGQLLQWVLEQTRSDNLQGHIVSDRELLQQAMRLHADVATHRVDLFKVIATIGHYYKALARNPSLTLGAEEARTTESGTTFIRNHHESLGLVYALDPGNTASVDANGRPVVRWFAVNDDGRVSNEKASSPIYFSTEDVLYHAWNFFLTSLYTHAKSLDEVKNDWVEFYQRHAKSYAPKLFYDTSLLRIVTGTLHTVLYYHKIGTVFQNDLPVIFKYLDLLGLKDFAMQHSAFSLTNETRGKEFEKVVFADAAIQLYDRYTTKTGMLRLTTPKEKEALILVPSAKTLEGGLSLFSYADRVNRRWAAMVVNGQRPVSRISAEYPEQYWNIVVAALQIQKLAAEAGAHVQLPFDPELVQKEVLAGRVDLEGFLKFGPEAWKIKFAEQTNSAEALGRLALDYSTGVRMAVAENVHTPASTLLQMSRSSDERIRADVGGNHSTPQDVLAQMGLDRSDRIRAEIASNESTPSSTLLRLSEDPADIVRLMTLGERSYGGNPKPPLAVLAGFLSDDTDKLFNGTQPFSKVAEEEIVDHYNGLGKHLIQAYQRWANGAHHKIPHASLAHLVEVQALLNTAANRWPERTWDEIPITGDISRDVDALITAVKNVLRARIDHRGNRSQILAAA